LPLFGLHSAQFAFAVIGAVKDAPCASGEGENRRGRRERMGTAAFSVVEEESSPWIVAHRALSRLAKERAAADAEEGRWLLEALRSAAHVHLGFGSFSEYVERCFGYKPRSTQEKLRVAEALEELPALASALAEGTLHWSAVRELTRVAAPETEREWLEAAHGKSVRQLEGLVAGRSPGDTPTSPSPSSERRHVLGFEVAPETFALFREAITALRRSTDGALDDDAALLAMARHVLGGPRDEGRASYQIALSVCEECGRGQQPSNGELVSVGPDIVAMAHCDGQRLGCITPRAANDGASIVGSEPSMRVHTGAGHHATDGVPRTPLGARVCARAQEGPRPGHAHVGTDAPLEAAPTSAPELPRAQQATPPALRRAVLARDHRRCGVPGCRNSAFLDVHHIQLRSEGGRRRRQPHHPLRRSPSRFSSRRARHRGYVGDDHWLPTRGRQPLRSGGEPPGARGAGQGLCGLA